uniref:Uncharacterized protein n=1 Tax=Arundo donax TaxID=35708 RepID=A0A0A8YLD5_ARUDO
MLPAEVGGGEASIPARSGRDP